MTRVLTPMFCLLLSAAAHADDKPESKKGDAMIDQYLAGLTKEISGRFLDGAKTREEWEKKRPRQRHEYLDMLGLWPPPEKAPLKATITGTLEHEGIVIEKLHFQSRPGLYVTANYYHPKWSYNDILNFHENKLKYPAVLYVCGHSGRGRDGNKTAFQDHGLWFAKNGYVCLIVDTLQLGEIPGIHHGTYREGRWWWQALGYTPAGVECWNGIRGIDYLVSRPEVDAERIGVTGISGGGAATIWIAAADKRVKVAVPVSGMSDLESYVTNKVINGHCDCMFLVNTYAWEWTTIAALIAPRPLLFANSDKDPIFPMDGNRRIIAKLRQVYKIYDKPDLVDEYISKGGHEDRADLRVAAFQWMNKHLKNDTVPVKYEAFKQLPGKELRVFPEDKDMPKDALNGKIDETFVKRAEVKLPGAGKFAEWKKDMLKQLRDQSFRSFPQAIPAARLEMRRFNGKGETIEVNRAVTEPGIEIEACPVLAKGEIKFLYVIGEDNLEAEDLKRFRDRQNYWYEIPRGLLHEWTKKSPPNYVERAHALLGRTVDTGRVRDIAAIASYLKEKEKADFAVVGKGQAGILAAYAALLEPSIKEVIILDPPTSHKDGPIFLNVLRVLDIPEALGLLAPEVSLTLIGAKDKAFDRTEQLYKLAGAEKKLQRK